MISLLIIIVTFLAGIGLYLFMTRNESQIDDGIFDLILERFLTRSFRKGDITSISGASSEEILPTLNLLVKQGILKYKKGRYRMIVPLFFLDEQHYQKALRLTANDELMYGATQQPFLSHYKLIAFYGIIPLAFIFSTLLLFDIFPDLTNSVTALFPLVDIRIFSVFLIIISIIFVDAIENVIKSWAQERFSVVVGAKAGIYFDEGFASELSGRIQRGRIGNVKMEISLLQKLMNLIAEVPYGDILIKERGKKTPIRFKNIPFPRELFFVIRRVQLKGLGWRKRHARTLMMWRTKSLIPTVGRP